MHFFKDIKKAVFVARPNRFIVECFLRNKPVRAYLPNPGRLWELFFPGTVLYLVKNMIPGSTSHTVVGVEREGTPIMLHTHVNNLVARELIENSRVPGLAGAEIIGPEVRIGRSRFDFLVRHEGKDAVIEVKSCTLVGDRIAMFPDAVTIRGSRHLRELAELAKEGKRAVVLFLVHWAQAEYFMPDWHTDPDFARTLLAVKDLVQVRAMAIEWKQDLELGHVKQISIPWEVIEQEARDRGSYIIITRLKRDRLLAIKGMGKARLKKGFYCYVGSAKSNLLKEMERHRRIRKNLHDHVDHLCAAGEFHAAIPVRASEDLHCAIASALGRMAAWAVPGFGSSQCGCGSHLFGMSEDPVRDRAFIDLLIHFRINRLEKYL